MNTEGNNVHVKGLTGELRRPTEGMSVIVENNMAMLELLNKVGEKVAPKQNDNPQED